MYKKITKINGVKQFETFKDVIRSVTILIKEFDDTDVDYDVENPPARPIRVEFPMKLKAPKSESFTDIGNITEETVMSWIENDAYCQRQIDYQWKLLLKKKGNIEAEKVEKSAFEVSFTSEEESSNDQAE
jgi:hypothetical protein